MTTEPKNKHTKNRERKETRQKKNNKQPLACSSGCLSKGDMLTESEFMVSRNQLHAVVPEAALSRLSN